jgi:hypothetical protein
MRFPAGEDREIPANFGTKTIGTNFFMNIAGPVLTVKMTGTTDMNHAGRNSASVIPANGKATGGPVPIRTENIPAAGDGKNTSAATNDVQDSDIPVPSTVNLLVRIHAGKKIDLSKGAAGGPAGTNPVMSQGGNMMNTSIAASTKFPITSETSTILLKRSTRTGTWMNGKSWIIYTATKDTRPWEELTVSEEAAGGRAGTGVMRMSTATVMQCEVPARENTGRGNFGYPAIAGCSQLR